MSEFAPPAPEHLEALPSPEHHEALPTPEQAEPLRPGEQDPRLALQEARQAVQEHAAVEDAAQALKAAEKPSESAIAPLPPNRELKAMALKRELKQVQRQLPAPSRSFSKVIHVPAVRAVSEAGAKTVSRPSGLLGGGILAFIGSVSYLFLATHVGFTYNYLIFLMLFAGGFVLGVLAELVVWLALRGRRADA